MSAAPILFARTIEANGRRYPIVIDLANPENGFIWPKLSTLWMTPVEREKHHVALMRFAVDAKRIVVKAYE